jgi:hypothetical protein
MTDPVRAADETDDITTDEVVVNGVQVPRAARSDAVEFLSNWSYTTARSAADG